MNNSAQSERARFWEIDVVRGVAVVMMVVYHFVFDLYFFQITDAILPYRSGSISSAPPPAHLLFWLGCRLRFYRCSEKES